MRVLARAGQLADREGAGQRLSVRQHDMVLRSIAAELGGVLRATDRTVQQRIGEARELVEGFPMTLDAWESGWITRGHVRIVMDAGRVVPVQRRAEFGAEAVRLCGSDTPNRVRAAVEILAERTAERSFTERHREAAACRRVRVVPGAEGMSDLVATLPTVIAEGVMDRLTQQATVIIDARSPEDDDARTTDQVRADVLSDLLLSGALTVDPTATGDGPGALGAIRAQVQVIVPVLTLLGTDDGPCDLVGRTPVDADTVRRLAANAPTHPCAHRPDRRHGDLGRPVPHRRTATPVPPSPRPALPLSRMPPRGHPLRDRPHHRPRPGRTHRPGEPRPPVPATSFDEAVHRLDGATARSGDARMDLAHGPDLPRRRPCPAGRLHHRPAVTSTTRIRAAFLSIDARR